MKSNSQKRKPTSRRNRRNGPGPRYAVPQMLGAPAGVSQDLQQFTRFYPSDRNSGLRMHVCAPITQILRESVSIVAPGALAPASNNVGMSLQMNLTQPARLTTAGTKINDGYTSPVFDLIASTFVRYKVNKLVFHYEPQSSATASERLVFAYANDPNHPVLWSAAVPTSSSLLSLADSIAFAPWRAWSMDVTSKLEDQLYYTYSDPSTSVGTFPERFSDFGVISCVGATTSAAADIPAGVLYMEVDVELREFCPISVTRPAAALHLVPRLAKIAFAGKSKKVVDWEDGEKGTLRETDNSEKPEKLDGLKHTDWTSLLPGRR